MNPEKVVFGFFILLALTLNFGFVYGEIDNLAHHHPWEYGAVLVVNLIATVLKLGDRSQMGAVLLATSLVAMLQLVAGAYFGPSRRMPRSRGSPPRSLSSVVSLAAGAMVANVVSVILLIIETTMLRR
jgi:hypothetical protein